MAFKTCKGCGGEVSTKVDKCPFCGAPVKRRLGLIVIIILGLILLGAIIDLFEERSEIANATSVLKYNIIKRQDYSYINTPRMKFICILNVTKIPSEAQIKETAIHIWKKEKRRKAWKELTVQFWLPDMEYEMEGKKYMGTAYAVAVFTPRALKEWLLMKDSLLGTKWWRKKAQFDRGVKIRSLEEKVRKIPVSKSSQNLEIYRQLLDLDPQNSKYKKKVTFYKARVEEQKRKRERGIAIAEAQVVCNKFKLVTKVRGSTLDFSVDTDLPDNTVVMVSVSRSYMQKGNPDRYCVDYFSQKGIIGKWKSKHRISIASEKWKSALRAKQKQMSKIGLGFDVASISDKITVRMVVPINQPDPRFGKRNSRLTGMAVRTTGLRVVEDEIEIDYPLDSPPVGKSPFPSLNPLELEITQACIVSRQTPLMPSHSPADPLKNLQKIKQIPKGGVFMVLEKVKKRGNPWYRVLAFDQRKNRIGTGWINSTALLSQKLKAYK